MKKYNLMYRPYNGFELLVEGEENKKVLVNFENLGISLIELYNILNELVTQTKDELYIELELFGHSEKGVFYSKLNFGMLQQVLKDSEINYIIKYKMPISDN